MDWKKLADYLPFNNPAKAVLLIVIFLASFFAIRSCEASETMLEGGATFLSGEYSKGQYILVEERFADGKYSIGLGIFGHQVGAFSEGPVDVRTNAYFTVKRNVYWKRLELGLGFGYWQNTNRALGCHVTFDLAIAVNIWRRLDARLGHRSNAGSCSPNAGQDAIGLSWRFN